MNPACDKERAFLAEYKALCTKHQMFVTGCDIGPYFNTRDDLTDCYRHEACWTWEQELGRHFAALEALCA